MPKRKKIRLKEYDYSSCGAYFVTICVLNKNALLWNAGALLRPHEPPLSVCGKITKTSITQIPLHYENVIVDKYCIMPNHVHIILFFIPKENRQTSAPTLSAVVGSMKRWVSQQLGFSIWQKSFNDNIIRNDKAYQAFVQYIDENSLKQIQGRSSARTTLPEPPSRSL
ncbi:MAG: transposase [Christensenella sp.]